MQVHLLTEGPIDEAILRGVLRPEIEANRLVVKQAGARSAAASLARTILASRREPVVLAIDADTTEESRVRELKEFYDRYLGVVAPGEEFRVVLFVPGTEVLLLADARLFEALTGRKLAEVDRARRELSPGEVLREAFHAAGQPADPSRRIQLLSRHDLTALRGIPPIPSILEFLEQKQATVPAGR